MVTLNLGNPCFLNPKGDDGTNYNIIFTRGQMFINPGFNH